MEARSNHERDDDSSSTLLKLDGVGAHNGKKVWTDSFPEPHALRHSIHDHITCASTRVDTTNTEEQKRRLDELIFWHAMSELCMTKNPSQHFEDVHQAFVGSYWSVRAIKSVSRYIKVYHWLAPRSPAMNASRHALCLIHLGTRYRDHRLLMEGRTWHCAALQCLRAEIQRPGAVNDDSILGACYTIAQCEVYRVIILGEGGDWQTHLPHLLTVFRQRRVKSTRSPFAQAVLHNTKQVAAMHGLLTRKRILFGSPGWFSPADSLRKPAMRLTNIFFRIAELLERADRLRTVKRQKESELVTTLTAMVELEQQMQQWLLDFYESTGGDVMPYREVEVSMYLSFKERCGGLAHIFPKVIEFSNFLSATSHVHVWVDLITVRQAIAEVARLHPYPLVLPVNQDAILVAAVEEIVSNLCKSVPYISQSEHSFARVLACGAPLHFAGER